MAFGAPSLLHTNQSKSAGGTLDLTTDENTPAGDIIVVVSAWDNSATSDGPTTQITVSDGVNTYTRIAERTESEGAADDGTVVSLHFTQPLAAQLNSGSTITVTNSSSETAKAALAFRVPCDESTVDVEDFVTEQAHDDDPASLTIPAAGSMTSQEYLLVDAFGQENNSGNTITWDADYTQIGQVGTTGGGAATNQMCAAATRIATLTTDTVDIANSTNVGGHVQILAALFEVAGGAVELNAETGSYSITGAAATLLQAALLTADPGSYAVTGVAATLTVGRAVSADPGVYAVTGAAATLTAGRVLSADPGTYAITGADATLLEGRVLSADPGVYTINGVAATLETVGQFNLDADPGVYTISGNAATLTAARALTADPGSYAVTGQPATLTTTRLLSADPGVYTINGAPATLTFSGAVAGPGTSIAGDMIRVRSTAGHVGRVRALGGDRATAYASSGDRRSDP